MKILIQWALKNPKDWVEVDSKNFSRLPKRPIPLSGKLGGQDYFPADWPNGEFRMQYDITLLDSGTDK